MKKLFTLISAVLLFVGVANAQERKSWDFSQGVSSTTRDNLDSDGSWTKSVNTDGVTTNWASSVAQENAPLTVNGAEIPELSGLLFTWYSANTNAINYFGTKLRLQKKAVMTLPSLKKGQTVKITAQSANSTATDRGIEWTDNLELTEGPDNGIILGGQAEGAPEGGITTFVWDVIADGAPSFTTGGALTAGIEILSITIDDGRGSKSWDFTSWSKAADICADETNWTKSESASKSYVTGDEIRWNLTTDVTSVPEFDGLTVGCAAYSMALAFNYGTTLDSNAWGPYNGGSYLWLCNTSTTITIPQVPAGSTIKVGVESHKLSEARGVNVKVDDATVASLTSANYAVLSTDLTTEEAKDVTLVCTKGSHLYSIEVVYPEGYYPGKVVESTEPEIGTPVLSIKDGAHLKASSIESISVLFPKAKNLPDYYEIVAKGTISDGENTVDIEFAGDNTSKFKWDYDGSIEFKESTAYTVTVNSVEVDDANGETIIEVPAGDEPLTSVTFETTGASITTPRSWAFQNSQDVIDVMATSSLWAFVSKNNRYQNTTTYSSGELMLTEDEKLPMTEGLYFNVSTVKDITIGSPATASNNRLQMGGGSSSLIIPSCSAGDEIVLSVVYATKNKGSIALTNATYEGESTLDISGISKQTSVSIFAVEDGDVTLKITTGAVFYSINIMPAGYVKSEYKYSVVGIAKDTDKVLKTYVEEGTVEEGTDVKGAYNMWLESDNMLYQAAATDKEYNYVFSISEDKTCTISYTQQPQAGIVYLTEAEDLEGTTLCTSSNAGVRASNSKAAYVESDLTVTTLPAGTYRICAAVFDANKSYGKVFLFKAGDQNITVTAAGENVSIVESEEFTLTEATPLVWAAEGTVAGAEGESDIVIYAGDTTRGLDAFYVQDMNVQNEYIATGISKPSTVKVQNNAAIYNLAGQKVGASYKGIVIKGGKKAVM